MATYLQNFESELHRGAKLCTILSTLYCCTLLYRQKQALKIQFMANKLLFRICCSRGPPAHPHIFFSTSRCLGAEIWPFQAKKAVGYRTDFEYILSGKPKSWHKCFKIHGWGYGRLDMSYASHKNIMGGSEGVQGVSGGRGIDI